MVREGSPAGTSLPRGQLVLAVVVVVVSLVVVVVMVVVVVGYQ
jgi:hypothetical protein